MSNRVVAFGGRKYRDIAHAFAIFDWCHAQWPISLAIHGDADGADTLFKDWARLRGIPDDPHPADWDNLDVPGALIKGGAYGFKPYNALAGFTRNQEMVDLRPNYAIGFRGSAGTKDMLRRLTKAGIYIVDAGCGVLP